MFVRLGGAYSPNRFHRHLHDVPHDRPSTFDGLAALLSNSRKSPHFPYLRSLLRYGLQIAQPDCDQVCKQASGSLESIQPILKLLTGQEGDDDGIDSLLETYVQCSACLL